MYRLVASLLIASLSGRVCGFAQQPEEEGSGKVADFSKGFEMLAGLGVPDTREAKWVIFPERPSSGSHGSNGSLRWLQNGVWLLPKPTPEASRRLIVDQVREEIALSDSAYEALLEEKRALYGDEAAWAMQNHWRDSGWEEGSLTDTVTEVLGHLEVTGGGIAQNAMPDSDLLPRVLLFAAHLWRRGMTEEANRLAQTALKFSPDAMEVLDRVVSILAYQALHEVTARFRANQDWSRYAEDLAGLLARFPRGWEALEAARGLHALAERRARAPVPVDLSSFRQAFPAGTAEILQRFVDEPQSPEALGESSTVLWTLEPPKEADGVLGEILSKGTDGVLMLAALVGDGALTPTFRPEGGMYQNSYFTMSMGRLDSGDGERPLTRSELAQAVLQPVIPESLLTSSADQFGETSWSGTLQSLIFDWAREMRGKPANAVALSYLEKGSAAQAGSAMEILTAQDEPEIRERTEAAILARLDDREGSGTAFELAKQYIVRYGSEAGEFFKQFNNKLTPFIDAAIAAATEEYEKRQWETLQTALLRLEGSVNGNVLNLLFRELDASEISDWSIENEIYFFLSEETSGDRERDAMELVQGIAAMGDAKRREGMFQVVYSWIDQFSEGESGSDPEDEGRRVEALAEVRQGFLREEARTAWQSLLADSTPVSSTWNPYARTSGDVSALVLTMAHLRPKDLKHLSWALRELGEDPGPTLRSMAEAYLLGKEPERAWPRADRVDEARGRELLEALQKMDENEIGPWLDSLNADEKLFLQDRFSTLEGPPEAWLAVSQTIDEVTFDNEADGKVYDWASLKGRRLTGGLLKEIIDRLRVDADPASDLYVRMASRGFGRGLRVSSGGRDGGLFEYLNPERFSGHLRVAVGDDGDQPSLCIWSADAEEPVEGSYMEFMGRFNAAIKQSGFTVGIRVVPRTPEAAEDE